MGKAGSHSQRPNTEKGLGPVVESRSLGSGHTREGISSLVRHRQSTEADDAYCQVSDGVRSARRQQGRTKEATTHGAAGETNGYFPVGSSGFLPDGPDSSEVLFGWGKLRAATASDGEACSSGKSISEESDSEGGRSALASPLSFSSVSVFPGPKNQLRHEGEQVRDSQILEISPIQSCPETPGGAILMLEAPSRVESGRSGQVSQSVWTKKKLRGLRNFLGISFEGFEDEAASLLARIEHQWRDGSQQGPGPKRGASSGKGKNELRRLEWSVSYKSRGERNGRFSRGAKVLAVGGGGGLISQHFHED